MFPDDNDALGRYELLLTLSAITRGGIDYRPVAHELVRHIVEHQTAFAALARWCGACSGLAASVFVDRFDDFCRKDFNDSQHFDAANLNALLSLHCGGPVPAFPFIADGRLDTQMVAWSA